MSDAKLEQRLAEVKAELRQEIVLSRADLREEIANLTPISSSGCLSSGWARQA